MSAKDLFFVLYFLEQGDGPYKFSFGELGAGSDPLETLNFLKDLENKKFIEIKKISLNYKRAWLNDFFLLKYAELIKKNGLEDAKRYARENNMEFINKTLEPMALSTLEGLFRGLFKGNTPRPIGREFFEDLLENIEFKIKNTKLFEPYLDQYLDNFVHDNLESPPAENSRLGNQDFYRYKKQRALFIQALWRKVDEKRPVDIELTSSDVSVDRINFIELWLSADEENLITVKKHQGSDSVVVDVNEKLLETVIKKEHIPIGPPPVVTNEQAVPTVAYNKFTGLGSVSGKKFKFKDGTAEYRIFASLYESIGRKISRISVLEIGHFYEEGEEADPTRKTLETAFINDTVKSIREKTGLSTEQLVQNNGNLTLIGVRAKNPTNEPQT